MWDLANIQLPPVYPGDNPIRRKQGVLERTCHQVTVNASGGQSNAMDGSAALEGIEEESEEED